MNYVLKNKDPLNQWNVILIYYVMGYLKFQKNVIILKVFLNI
jgi:hypothetical protein